MDFYLELPPLKIVSPFSTPSSSHMTLTALYSRHGKKRCAFGAAAVLRRRQDNGRRNSSGNGNFRPHNRGSPSASQGNSSGITHATNVAAAPTQPPAPSSASGLGPALMADPTMRYGSAFSGNTNPNARQPGTFQVQPAPTP